MTAVRRRFIPRFRLAAVAALATSTILWVAQSAEAGAGDLDTSFGGSGFVRYPFDANELAKPEGPIASAAAILPQPDGKLVIGVALGEWANDGYYTLWDTQVQDFVLLRFNADGSRDPTFDGDGRAGPDFPGFAASTGAVLR